MTADGSLCKFSKLKIKIFEIAKLTFEICKNQPRQFEYWMFKYDELRLLREMKVMNYFLSK